MKRIFLLVLFALTLALNFMSAQAAEITITTTAPQANRLAVAVGARLGLHDAGGKLRSATAAEVKAFLIDYTRTIVRDQERLAAIAAAEASAVAFDPQ